MEFQTDAQRACYANVVHYMSQVFGELASVVPDQPIITVTKGSALVRVAVFPWYDNGTVVDVRSWVVTNVKSSEELFAFLLNANTSILFGAFGLDDQGDVWLRQSLVGQTMDEEELIAAVRSIAWMADEYDDMITRRFGGAKPTDLGRLFRA